MLLWILIAFNDFIEFTAIMLEYADFKNMIIKSKYRVAIVFVYRRVTVYFIYNDHIECRPVL